MYAPQANTGIAPLDAVLATAQMVTPEQTPTVAAQVAQAAQQKMQSQGIMGGMPQATQDFRTAAHIDNMKRMQMQQAMQQMAAQMTAEPVGIERLPAQNMRTFAAAQGGVVGYAGPTGSEVEVDETKLPVDERFKRKLRSIYEAIETDFMQRAGATPEMIARKLGKEPPAVPAPIPEGSDRRLNIPAGGIVSPGMTQETPAPRPPAPATRPPAPPSAAAAPQSGVAALVPPTPEGAMASARSTLGLPGTEGLRAKEAAYLAALKAQPAAGQQGLAALQAQQAGLQSMYDRAEKESNINSVIQQLLGRGEGPGGAARASIAFSEREDARRRAYYDLQVANATKRDAIKDLQNARDVGNAKAALEAEQRIRQADLAVAKAEGDLAAHFATSQAQVYGAQMRSQDEAANRATQLQIARIQAAARNDPQSKEAMAMARVQQAINSSPMLKALAEQAKFDPSAAARYRVEEEALYKRVAPELFGAAGAAPAAASNDPLGLRR